MKAVVLQTQMGDQLGFVLCAIPSGQLTGDCVFSIIPAKPELFDQCETQELFQRKDVGESRIQLSSDLRSAMISSAGMDDMFIELDESGVGEWGYVRDDGKAKMGRAFLAKKQ